MNNRSTLSRRISILEQLNKAGHVTVPDLSKRYKVSEVTIRNDLTQLEKQNMLIKTRGGALKVKQRFNEFDYPLSDKEKVHLKEKMAIGRKATEFIRNGNTIILDSGTTTFEIARNIEGINDLTVITNALNIAGFLAENNHINVIVPGGTLRKNSASLVGILSERGFKNYFCDILFLGVDGFDIDYGISTPNYEEAHLNQVMIEVSKQVIVVTDSSKFQKRGFAFIAPVNKIHVVITDEGISPSDKVKLENLGISVVIARTI